MNHRGTEARREEGVTGSIIGAAIEVHRALGPGLLESAYQECLCRELEVRGVQFARQVPVPLEYKGIRLECGYRVDLIVAGQVVVELKAIEGLLPIHEAQLLTYLRLLEIRIGLLINFHVAVLKHGVRRMVLDPPSDLRASVSPWLSPPPG